MADEHCLKEKEWGVLETTLSNVAAGIKRLEDSVGVHITDADKPGGYRERLLLVEQKAAQLEKNLWSACLMSGIIGGLLGKLSPDVFHFLVKTVFASPIAK